MSRTFGTLLAGGSPGRGSVPEPAPLDSVARIETPEGIELELRLAGPLPRILAWLIDLGLRAVIYLVLMWVAGWLGGVGWGLVLIALFVLEWFYPVVWEVYFDGATPGKRALRLQVLHEDGTPVAWPGSLVRNLLRAVDFLPFLYGFGFVCMTLNPQFRRLGDLAAGTVVAYRLDPAPHVARPGAERLAPPIPLTRSEGRAVMEFAERAPYLAPERAAELAGLAEPLVGRSPEPVSRLYAIANHLAGAA